MSDWISVEDRMPEVERDGVVLVKVRDEHGHEGELFYGVVQFGNWKSDKGFYDWDSNNYDEHVAFWKKP